MSPLIRRQQMTQLTIAKYGKKPFKWGSCDCAKVAAFHARKFGWKVPAAGSYKSAVGAARYLKGLGCDTLPDLIDRVGLVEIPPAFAMTGDLVSFASDHPIGAIGIVVDNGNMMAFHEDHPGLVFMSMTNIDRVWSIMQVPNG